MSILSALIRKRESRQLATAIPAISATPLEEEAETVARIATVAVATPTDEKAADDVTSWGWLLHFADRDPLEVYCHPNATHAAILERYPGALAADPILEGAAPAYDVEWPELDMVSAFPDERRTCEECANLAGRRCLAAWRGEIVANRDYEPVRDQPRRCEGYVRPEGAPNQEGEHQ